MRPETPFLLVNFKTEREAFGERALQLASICDVISRKHGVSICVAPHLLDLQAIATHASIPVFAQHFHAVSKGKTTGHIPAESLKLAGASGVIINHCEKPLPMGAIKERVEAAREWGLTSIVCAANVGVAADVARFGPDFISYEPPEYIGSSTASVATAKPDVLREAVTCVRKLSPGTEVLCGAGVSSGSDVTKALDLGSRGFLISRAVVKAEDPCAVLDSLCRAIRSWNGRR